MMKMAGIFRRVSGMSRSQRGIGLVETLVAVALLGTAITTFVSALSTGSIAVGEQDQATIAQSVLQSQLEYVKSLPYNAAAVTYPTLSTPAGYTVSVAVTSVPNTDTTIQKITVTVLRDGQTILSAEDYKVDR